MSELNIVYKKIDTLEKYKNNARTHSDEQVQQIAKSITEFGFTNPILTNGGNTIIAGHGRLAAAKLLKLDKVPTIALKGLSNKQMKALIIADNQLAMNAGWDLEILGAEIEDLKLEGFDIDLLGFDDDFLNGLFGNEPEDPYADGKAGSMSDNFGQPPFSILDTRKGDWLARKRMWHEKIGDNGESREGTLASEGSMVGEMNNGVSILDPVMAELVVRWFGTEGGLAFDPFAGDSVFGYVAGTCGMGFEGIELRQEQAELNQFRTNADGLPCKYYCDTSENMDKYIKDDSIDLMFSCPPYADLEIYSDNPNDLSNMSHDDFFKLYSLILGNTFSKLKNNRFAVVVMGEVRGKDGGYIGTIPKTITAMERVGYKFYNEIVIVNSAGTLPLRAGKSMRATRKIGKMHQNLMVFIKGDAKQAGLELGDIVGKIDFEVDEEDGQ